MRLISLFLIVAISVCGCQSPPAETNPTIEEEAQGKLEKLIRAIQVPPESYLTDYVALFRIYAIRRQAFQKYGIRWYHPIANRDSLRTWWQSRNAKSGSHPIRSMAKVTQPIAEQSGGPAFSASLPPDSQWIPNAFFRTSRYDGNQSSEHFWVNELSRACITLTKILNGEDTHTINGQSVDEIIRSQLKKNPEKWTHQIKPQLLLLSQSPLYGLEACAALVAGGERSEYLKGRLNEFLYNPISFYDYEDVAALIKQCGWDVLPKDPSPDDIPLLPIEPTASLELTTREGKHPHQPLASFVSTIDSHQSVLIRLSGVRDPEKRVLQVNMNTGALIKNSAPWAKACVVGCGPNNKLVLIEDFPTGQTHPNGKPITGQFMVLREPKTRSIRWKMPVTTGRISSLQISPDGKYVVAIEGSSTSMTSKLRVHDAQDGHLQFRQAASRILPVHFVPGGGNAKRLPAMVTLSDSGEYAAVMLTGWDSWKDMLPRVFNPLVTNSALALTPDGKTAVTISGGDFVYWDLMRDYNGRWDDEPMPTLQRKRIAISLPGRKFFKGFEFTPEGKFLMGGSSRNILFWTREGRCIGRLELPEGKRIYQMRRFGDTLAVLGHDGRLTLWNCTQITQALQKRSKSSN